MITKRPGDERGLGKMDWLTSYHSFSFADYHDPDHMGFGALRVINEDTFAPGGGFDTHPHRDMEIISYILQGRLEHKDSLGNGGIIQAGEVQRMTAGTGIRHSEFNPSDTEPVHFLQIWVVPAETGLAPGYEQKKFGETDKQGRLCPIATPDGRDGSLVIHQDAALYGAQLGPGGSVRHDLAPGRGAWIQVTDGAVHVNGTALVQGDGAAVTDEDAVNISADAAAGLVLFDLA